MIPTMVLVTEVPTLLPMMTGMPSLSVMAPLAAIATTIEVVAEEDCQRYIFNGAEAETCFIKTQFFEKAPTTVPSLGESFCTDMRPNFR